MAEQLALDLAACVEIGSVECAAADRGARYVIGADEVGRGPLAGPVVAAAVAVELAALDWVDDVDDSKRLRADVRQRLAETVRRNARAWAICAEDAEAIDASNIRVASLRAMRRAIEQVLSSESTFEPHRDVVVVDGRDRIPELSTPHTPVIRGDGSSYAIAAASILAKVARDTEMIEADRRFPGYGFAQHKGYPTPGHRRALSERGATPIHRKSYAPVAAVVQRGAMTTSGDP